MFNRLMKKWGVGPAALILILVTFALGGSLCGYLARILLQQTSLDYGAIWVILYIFLVTLLWPVCVLLISIPTRQFPFFRNYIRKIGKRMFTTKNREKQNTP